MLRELPTDPSATMRSLDFRSLHQVYAAWRDRVPIARPRRIHVAAELLANPHLARYGDGLAAVVTDIALGGDLRPRMSTLIERAYSLAVPPALARRPPQAHVDRLLADWGLHHLHLGTDPHRTRPGFVRRSAHVLLAAFMPNDAYLVDLAPHESDGGNWAALHILEVIVRHWPDAGIVHSLESGTGLSHGNWSDEDRRSLRSAGGATGAVEIDGRVWVAGLGGQGLTGIPMRVAQHCMYVSWLLSGYDPTEEGLSEHLTALALKHGKPDTWRAITHGESFGFYNDGLFVPYGSLSP